MLQVTGNKNLAPFQVVIILFTYDLEYCYMVAQTLFYGNVSPSIPIFFPRPLKRVTALSILVAKRTHQVVPVAPTLHHTPNTDVTYVTTTRDPSPSCSIEGGGGMGMLIMIPLISMHNLSMLHFL